MRVLGFPTAEAAAEAAGDAIGVLLRGAIQARGCATLAASGGRTPGPAWEALVRVPLDWARITVFQVDERVVGEDDPARNLRGLRRIFGAVPVALRPMPLDGSTYDLPPELDVVQLGMGGDGHTASLFPAPDPGAPDWPAGDFGQVGPHLGHTRWTLGFAPIRRARARVFLITGADKAPALRRVLAGDTSLPAASVGGATVFADQAALGVLAG